VFLLFLCFELNCLSFHQPCVLIWLAYLIPLMSLSPADITIQLLMDTMNTLQEIESRVTARAFGAVMEPTKGPAVRETLELLLAVLDESSPDGVI
jgi:hypothetical protein